MSAPGETAVAIIPARLASTRFPRKVLASETGYPLVWHVAEAARGAGCVSRVVVAADDEEIERVLAPLGVEVVLTSREHENGTSRLAEAASLLELDDRQIVVNVQGDEPELDPGLIEAAVAELVELDADVATVACPLGDGEDAADPNVVKVVTSLDGYALYFSRAAIPHCRGKGAKGAPGRPLRHVGLYVYRRAFLDEYVAMERTPLERTEGLEQLRVLEHVRSIAVAVREGSHVGIDTPGQYQAFVARWRASKG